MEEMNEAEETTRMSRQQRQTKRGPLLPRADLTNKSPEEEDDDDSQSSGGDLKLAAASASALRPPQPPQVNNNKRKNPKHLPVKSSGYGRVNTNSNSTSSSSSSSRPSTPIIERRLGSSAGSYSLPASPANSVSSRSSIRSSAALQLRYGDGTLPGGNGGGRFKKPTAAIKSRSRSSSPAPSSSLLRLNNPTHIGRDDDGNNTRKKTLARSRTPSPALKRTNGSSALKRLKQFGSATKLLTHHAPSVSNNFSLGHHHHHHEQQQHQLSSPRAQQQSQSLYNKDYSQIDADPTPVREARRLSSIFHNRPTAVATTTSFSTDQSMGLSSPLPRTCNTNSEKKTPLSYSKVLKKGLVNDNASSPLLSAMKLFQPSNSAAQSINSHNAKEEPALFEGYTNPNTSQTSHLSTRVFSRTSGIDTDNLQRLLDKSKSRKGGDTTTTKQWELRKRLECKEEELGMVRTALKDLLCGKEEFVTGSIEIEEGLRTKIVEVQGVFEKMASDKSSLSEQLVSEEGENATLKTQLQELLRERDSYQTKCDVLSSELGGSKVEVGKLQQFNTDSAVALALLQSKLEESQAQNEDALVQIQNVESSKVDAVKSAEEQVFMEMSEDLSKMSKENERLKSGMRVRQAKEEEICRLLDVDVASLVDVDAGDSDAGSTVNSFLDTVKQRIETFQQVLMVKENMEKNLESCNAELEKVKADYQAALETASTKEHDTSELLRERDSYQTKCDVLSSELNGTRSEVGKTNTDNAVALALLQSKLEDVRAQNEEALAEVERVESSKMEAVKIAEEQVFVEMSEDLAKMSEDNERLKNGAKVRQVNEDEICRLLDVDVASLVDVDSGGEDSDSFLNLVSKRLEEIQKDVKIKEEVEKNLESCKVELEKVKVDYQAALETVATKERDMSELMKSIGDIQRSGQDREQEVANQRNAAEDRATAAESQIVESREKLLSLGYEKKTLEEALEASKAACADCESVIANLQKEIGNSKIETVQHDSQLQLERDLRSKSEEKENEERAERIALAAQLHAQLQEHAASEKHLRESMESMERTLNEQIRNKEDETKMKQADVDKCQQAITALEAHQLSLKQSLTEQKSMLDTSKEEEIGRLKGEIANLESRLKGELEKLQSAGVVSKTKVMELEEIIRIGQAEKKRMHNIIQELRGNVRVFARIRPFIPDDGKQGEEGTTPFVSHDGDALVTVPKPNDPNEKHKFSFDRVFAPSAGQETVFDEVSEFVQSALDGYHVCLFSYGQTGSGKTFTMQGTGMGVMRGIIPRSIEQIGSHKLTLEKDGWKFSMEVSFLEIYNETLRDLLRENGKEERKHEIKVGSDGRSRMVTNLTLRSFDPNDRDAVEAVLALAAKRRSTASTDMNATSSRSHSVFTLNMTAEHEERNQMLRGTLNLVDLAGSERLDRSNAKGQHAKEAMAINKSLSSLTDVFTAIGQKASHIPFRNSRLTYLLQPALSQDGKTCMVVNISPTEGSQGESLSSLRFASKVNKCELGKAKRTIGEVKNNGASKRGNAKSSAASRNAKRKI